MSSVYSCDLLKGEASLTSCAGLVIDVFASKSAAVFLDAGLLRLGILFTFLLTFSVLGHSRI